MGADQFYSVGKGETIAKAFAVARDEAFYEYGHRGYTGSLAEKDSYVVIETVIPATARQVYNALSDGYNGPTAAARDLFGANAERYQDLFHDKWGPCVAYFVGPDTWAFMGYASS
jgi:hypothetical protein